jgi:alkylhydroperoxidase family enzyme
MTERLPYITDSAPQAVTATAQAVRERRGGTLLNLDRILLHSEPLAKGWNTFLGMLRRGCALDGRLRELAILRIALLTRAPYEHYQHVPEALACGASQIQIDALPEWRQLSALFSATEQAVLAYTDEMTQQVQVSDATYAAVRAALSDSDLVELTATIGAYNMVARFLEAFLITPQHEGPMP